MTSPLPRLSPTEVLAVLDQMVLEAQEATQMAVWRHNMGCYFTVGIWDAGAVCRSCQYGVGKRDEVEQYLLVPVRGQVPVDDRCKRCHGYGQVPDFAAWNEEFGEPKPTPCPHCNADPRPQGSTIKHVTEACPTSMRFDCAQTKKTGQVDPPTDFRMYPLTWWHLCHYENPPDGTPHEGPHVCTCGHTWTTPGAT